MSAKEMFEELGFRQSFFGDKDNKCIIYDIENETTFIMFKPSTKEYDYVVNGIKAIPYNNQLLQAINKQIEELGWNK